MGNADPRALQVAVAAAQALDWVGLPEAQYALAQATAYIATAPKSNRAGPAYWAAVGRREERGSLPVPKHLRTGRGRVKRARHRRRLPLPARLRGADVDQQYLPDELAERRYYLPSEQGYERTIGERMAGRQAAREGGRGSGGPTRIVARRARVAA